MNTDCFDFTRFEMRNPAPVWEAAIDNFNRGYQYFLCFIINERSAATFGTNDDVVEFCRWLCFYTDDDAFTFGCCFSAEQAMPIGSNR